MAQCAIPGCDRFVRSRGLCDRDYRAWLRSREPGTSPGEPLAYLLAVLTTMPAECTEWPYARNWGYAWIAETQSVSVLVCTWYHGERPAGLVCCHSCGRGTSGCFTPSHLRWDTKSADAYDRSRHKQIHV